MNADAVDTIKLKPGIYELMTYANGYAIHTNHRVKMEAGMEYDLHAPLSKEWTRNIKAMPERLVTIKTGKLVKMVSQVEETEVEVAFDAKIRKVSIRPSETEGAYVLRSADVEAITTDEIEIDEGKFYTKTNETKKQIKILPSQASDIAKKAIRIHNVNNMELKIVEKNLVYIVEGEQDAKFFGLIPTKVNIVVEIDGERGNVTKIIKPFWSQFAIANK